MAAEGDDCGQKYALGDKEKEDPATKEWCKLIDLDTVIESELDWHSTRTFELFLDALDVNQNVIKDDKKKKKSNPKNDIKTDANSKASPPTDETRDKIVTNNSTRQNGSKEQKIPSPGAIKKNVDIYQGVETILSAEALKVLSELPDLSHMATTRSFIFPKHKAVRR